MTSTKPYMSLRQVVNMNVGFFGIQYSFGLQQANMSPIYSYLGANEAALPLLWLAGPVTGLIVQPIIGAMSDRTVSRWGRRTPYFMIGALICSFCLLFMPFSSALWMAASLLWILDAANNVTMEPYRAYVSDRLDKTQHTVGFLMQSAFTGLAQTLAYLTPTFMLLLGLNKDTVNASNIPHITIIAFMIGAFLSIATVYWSVKTTPELPLTASEIAAMQAKPTGTKATLTDIWVAFKEMPDTMRRLWWMKLFQWYGMMCYWIYIVPAITLSLFGTRDGATQGFRDASLLNGQIGGFYNFVAFLAAFAMIPFSRKFGPRLVHALCLTLAGIGMLSIPSIQNQWLLFIPMVGVGLAWASIMGNPYIMLANSIPPERAGVYMGIFNMFIVVPMIIQMLTLPLIYSSVLASDPGNVLRLAGVFLIIAAVMTLRIPNPPSRSTKN
jgi:maltose/moltooligosaccharide transporter